MNTTDGIMELADDYADWAVDKSKTHPSTVEVRAALRTAIEQLVEQAKWAHHTPKLLSDADAAADLAGVARPGAEPAEDASDSAVKLTQLILSDCGHSTAISTALLDRVALRITKHTDSMFGKAHTPQARQPETRPSAEPVLFIHPDTFAMASAHVGAWKPGHYFKGYIPLYTAPPQASQPLTLDAIAKLLTRVGADPDTNDEWHLDLVRAIEAAHGIAAQKGKP